MRKAWIILLILGAVGTACYFSYRLLAPREEADPFRIIPASASLILETSDASTFLHNLKSEKSWENIQTLPFIAALEGQMSLLDSLMPSERKRYFLQEKRVVASLHASSPASLGWIFYVPLETSSDLEEIGSLLNASRGKGYKTERQDFADLAIYSIYSTDKSASLYCFVYKNLLVLGTARWLTEEAARTVNGKNPFFFWKKEEVREQEFFEGKVRAYLRYENLPVLLSLVADAPLLSRLKSFARESIFELSMNDQRLLLNGYTFSSPGNSYLDIIKGQKPQNFHARNLTPNSTEWVYYLGFDKPDRLADGLYKYWKQQDQPLLKSIDSLDSAYHVRLKELYQYMEQEVALCAVAPDSSEQAKLVFIQTNNARKLYETLGAYSRKMAGKDSGQAGEAGSFKTGKLNVPEFPSKIFGRMFSGFPVTYFTVVENYLVLASSRKAIKNLLSDMESENVWGKTFHTSVLLEDAVSAFNLGFFVNISQVESGGRKYTGKHILKAQQGIDRFDFLAVQFADVGETVLTNVLLTHHLSEPAKEEALGEKEVLLDHPVRRIFVVNSKEGHPALLVQDSSRQIYFMENDCSVKWKRNIPDEIKGEAYLADLDRDGREDIVFAAGNNICSYSGNGKELKYFPVRCKGNGLIRNLSLIDYDGRRDYRLAVTDSLGNIYLYNNKGKNLEGWQPLALQARPFDRLKHLRVEGKDVLVITGEGGTIHAFNRKGEALTNFPVHIYKKIVSPSMISKGRSLAGSFIKFLAEDGYYYQVNLEGKINEKPAGASSLAEASGGNSFLLRLEENGRLLLRETEGRELLNVPKGSQQVYYQFPVAGKTFLLRDMGKKQFELRDSKGKLLKTGSVREEESLQLVYDTRRRSYFLYRFLDNKIELEEF